jgi:hypothetical protein
MSREVLDSGSSDTDWDEPGVVPPRMSVLSRRWRGSLVLVLAFLLGATVGGIGWDTWRDRQDIAAASSAVDLTARLRNVPTLTGNDTLVQAFVLIENDGPRTVRIERISIVGPGYVPPFDDSAITPDGLPVEIEGGRGEQATLIWRVIDCTGAVELDFNDLGVLVTGRLTGPEIQTAVTVDPDVALDVVAFVAATCRAA